MDQQEQPRSWPTKRQLLWAVGIVAVLTIAVLIGYRYGITLWDWLKLLVVPAVIAGGGIWFNRQQRERELEIAREQRERDELIADWRAQDEAVQAYLDQMSKLLLENDLRDSTENNATVESKEARTLARARTLTVLSRLDAARKRDVVQFLYESRLIAKDHPVLDLRGADLSGADLTGAVLSEADLMGADLSDANLRHADLREANLRAAVLNVRSFEGAVISADLSDADLSRANLRDVPGGITDSQIAQAKTLEGATMPNGQKYEEWLKDRERRGEAE